jgi:hypothetical protein
MQSLAMVLGTCLHCHTRAELPSSPTAGAEAHAVRQSTATGCETDADCVRADEGRFGFCESRRCSVFAFVSQATGAALGTDTRAAWRVPITDGGVRGEPQHPVSECIFERTIRCMRPWTQLRDDPASAYPNCAPAVLADATADDPQPDLSALSPAATRLVRTAGRTECCYAQFSARLCR